MVGTESVRWYQLVIDVTGPVEGIYEKVEIWAGVTDDSQTDWLTDFER